MNFTLSGDEADVVWVCGYEPGAEELVRRLRYMHPEAFIVVTGRGAVKAWSDGVETAGGDYCCGWPLPLGELNRILHLELQS